MLRNDIVVGAINVGPLQMTEPDQFLYDKILENSRLDASSNEDVVQIIKSVPLLSTTKVKALADLLLISVHYIDEEGYVKFQKDKELMEQRSEIANYMAYLKTMGGYAHEDSAYPIEKEKELMRLISIGDQNGANRVLNEIMAHIYIEYGMDYKLFKSRVLELVVMLSRAALEGGAQAEEIFGLNYSYLNEIHAYESVDQLTEWLGKISQRFTTTVFRFGKAKHQDAIYKARDYIKRNYMNKISLEEVAEYVHFSGPYFSQIFKEETGITFNKYLNKIRITTSKKMLKDKEMSMVEIADAIGYNDQSHFSKMFKLIVGISPKKFGESLKG